MSPADFSAAQPARGAHNGAKRWEALLPRVLELAQEGKAQRDIVEKIGLSNTTVNSSIKKACTKSHIR